jgi:hypothetical protein
MCYCIVIDLSYIMYNDSWRRNKSKSKSNVCYGFMVLGLRLYWTGDFLWCLEGNHQRKCRFTSGLNRLIRLAAFVKEKAPGDKLMEF